MSEGMKKEFEERAQLEGFEIEMRLDATVKVGDWDFVKPGVSTKVKFSTVPDEKRLRTSIKFMNDEVLSPTLEEIIVEVQKQLRSARGSN